MSPTVSESNSPFSYGLYFYPTTFTLGQGQSLFYSIIIVASFSDELDKLIALKATQIELDGEIESVGKGVKLFAEGDQDFRFTENSID